MPMSPRLLRPRQAGGFNPRSIANLQLWLDASDVSGMRQLSDGTTAVAASADPVGYWPDKSGNGYHATQTTTNNRPTYRVGVRNGRSTLRWDGSNDSYRVASIPLDATISVFVVAQFNVAGTAGNATGNLAIEHSANSNNFSGFAFFGSDNAVLNLNRTGSPVVKHAISGATAWLGTDWSVAEARISGGVSATAAMDYWKSGALQNDVGSILSTTWNTGTITSGRSATADLFIGSRNQASIFSNGDYAEILIYNRPLSDSEHGRVRRYLAAKWGIAVYQPPTYADADANAYITAVETADGQALETSVRDAINTFIIGCKADGIWSSIKASCILAGARTLAGALTPLVGAAPTNNNFVSGDYNRKTGLIGNGSTKYLNSNRNNNADPQDNKHLAAYKSANVLSGVGTLVGAQTASSGGSWLLDNSNTNSDAARINAASSILGQQFPAVGFVGASRSSSSGISIQLGGVSSSGSLASAAPLNSDIWVFGGVGSQYANARLAFYSIGENIDLALLDARVTSLYNAIGAAIP